MQCATHRAISSQIGRNQIPKTTRDVTPGWQSEVFNGVTRHIKKQGGNEYDGAIGFMLVQIESLQDDTNQEVLEWKNRMTQVAHSIMPMGRIGVR